MPSLRSTEPSPGYLRSGWCELSWTAFVPFGTGRAATRALPAGPGLYRVRVAGRDELAYVGQTGRNLRERLAALARQTLAAEMPFNDPHTAAPKLWSYRDAEGLAYEASAAACELATGDRMALECLLVWQYRRESGRSPLCNFGRPHPRYTTSRNRSTGVRGRRLADGEPDSGGGPSVPPLGPRGAPGADDWMGLAWSPRRPLTAAVARAVAAAAGVYRVTDGSGAVVYIGQSTALAARLRLHAAHDWGGPVSVSFAGLPAAYTPAQLLEVENDLIGGYYAHAGRAPARQFGRRGESPVD